MSVIIDYNHEDGTLNEWEGNTDSSEVTAQAAAALAGTNYGIQVVVDDTTGAYVYRTSINNTSGKMRARFYIDPNSLTMASNDTFVVFYARDSTPDTFCSVYLRYNNTDGYCLFGRIVNDAGTGTNTALDGNKITDGPHYVEIYVQRASTADANDGRLDFWVDGVNQQTISGVDCYNRFQNTNTIGLGAIASLLVGTTGTFYLDELVVNDDGSQIGGIWVQKFTGGMTPSGVLTGDYQPGGGPTEMTLTGGVSPSGTISKSLARKLIGAITPRGPVAYAMNIAKTLTGASTPTGTLARVLNIVRSFAGEVTSAGAYVGNKVSSGITYMTFVGAVAMAGVQTRVLNLARTLAGAITPTGTAIKSLTRKLTGAVNMGGVLSNIKAKVATFTGAVTMGGTFARVLNLSRVFTGAVTMAGTLARRLALSRIFTGAVTMAGTLVQSIVGLYTAIVALTLRARSAALTLLERDNKLTVWARRFGLTVKERD